MGKKYKVDRSHNIGTVIFIVEGGGAEGGTELRLLKAIFTDVLGYETKELRRGADGEFVSHGSNPYSVVYGLNLPKNQLTQLKDETVDRLFFRLRTEFGIKPENSPVFLLYDRDVKSYGKNELREKYVKRYTDPYGTESGEQGQLLLSYPSVESYIISCFRDDSHSERFELGKDLKKKTAEWGYSEGDIREEAHLIHAAQEMDAALEALGCGTYDIDQLAPTLLAAYEAQQELYKAGKTFSLLSQISFALMERGILVEDAEENE